MSVLAGHPYGSGSADGTGAAASFALPKAVAVDASGNVYVADTNNSVIRKITAAGEVTTLAGTAGLSGSIDGTGTAALFSYPQGIAVDASGNVYVADTRNSTIRHITPQGVVTTLAGTAGAPGNVDDVGNAARFNSPAGIAVDRSGDVLVADTGNNTIRTIAGPSRSAPGLVKTLAGGASSPSGADGTGAAANFNRPLGIALNASTSSLYVADYNNQRIRKVTSKGVVTTVSPPLDHPTAVVVDASGNVYVAESGKGIISEIAAADGKVMTVAGTGVRGAADGPAAAAAFNNHFGLARDGAGNLYVADTYNSTIRKISTTGVVSTLAGTPAVAGSADGSGGAASFSNPEGVAVDASGNVYVVDSGNNLIRKITPDGVVSTLAGPAGSKGLANGSSTPAIFAVPHGIAVDASGNVYVADIGSNTIRKITSDGVVTTLAGNATVAPGYVDDMGSAARFRGPVNIAVDAFGYVYVADLYNHIIRKVTPMGAVSTLAGTAGATGAADGTGANARFDSPVGIAVDGVGNVYVADIGNNNIRKITANGEVTTLAGNADVGPGSADGVGSAALFNSPEGVAVDLAGNVYVADAQNDTIRKITPARVVSTVVGTAGSGRFSPGALPGSISIAYGNRGGLALAPDHSLYFTNNNAVVKVSNLP